MSVHTNVQVYHDIRKVRWPRIQALTVQCIHYATTYMYQGKLSPFFLLLFAEQFHGCKTVKYIL